MKIHKSGVVIRMKNGFVPTMEWAERIVRPHPGEEIFITDASRSPDVLGDPWPAIRVRHVCIDSGHTAADCSTRFPIVPEAGCYPKMTLEEYRRKYGGDHIASNGTMTPMGNCENEDKA